MFNHYVYIKVILYHVAINLATTTVHNFAKLDNAVASLEKESTIGDKSSVQISHTLQSKLLEKIDESLSDFEDISTDSVLLENHLTREVNNSESEFQKLARASMIQIEEKVITPYRTELIRMKKTIVASNHKLQRKYINELNLLLDNSLKTSKDLRETLDGYIEVLVGKSHGNIR